VKNGPDGKGEESKITKANVFVTQKGREEGREGAVSNLGEGERLSLFQVQKGKACPSRRKGKRPRCF